MNKPRLVYYDVLQFQPENRHLLDSHFAVSTLPSPDADTPDLLAQADVCFAPLGYYFGREKIDACKRLQVIASSTTGEQHIDVTYATGRKIAVFSLKGERAFLRQITPTAELTIALIVNVMRNMYPAYQSVLQGRWNRRPFGATKMLSRCTLGIAGFGRLGSMVGRYGRAMGMRVLTFDDKLRAEEPGMHRCETLEEMLPQCDVVSLHLPYEAGQPPRFDRAMLGRMRPGAYLVNTARGELIDDRALIALLESGHIKGAATDALAGEFVPGFEHQVETHPLVRYARSHPNLLITPHIGGSTRDAWHDTEAHTIERIMRHLDTENITNRRELG